MEEEANSHFIFFTMCFTNLNLEGEKTVVDLRATDYIF